MRILVIDGMGGGLGKAIIRQIKGETLECEIMAVGTNASATGAMLSAGADWSATGENAVVYNCRHADLIVGALGIAFANSMHGEISEAMAHAVSASDAHKLLLPVSKCNVTIAGGREEGMGGQLKSLTEEIRKRMG